MPGPPGSSEGMLWSRFCLKGTASGLRTGPVSFTGRVSIPKASCRRANGTDPDLRRWSSRHADARRPGRARASPEAPRARLACERACHSAEAGPPKKGGRNKAPSTLEPEHTPPRPPSGAGVEYTAGAASSEGAQPAADAPEQPIEFNPGQFYSWGSWVCYFCNGVNPPEAVECFYQPSGGPHEAPGATGPGRPVPGARTTTWSAPEAWRKLTVCGTTRTTSRSFQDDLTWMTLMPPTVLPTKEGAGIGPRYAPEVPPPKGERNRKLVDDGCIVAAREERLLDIWCRKLCYRLEGLGLG